MNQSNFPNSRRNRSQPLYRRNNRIVSRPLPQPLLDIQYDPYAYEQQSHQDSQRLQERLYTEIQNVILTQVRNSTSIVTSTVTTTSDE